MLSTGTIKKERRNPNDPARFIGKVAATEDGETAKIHNYLDTEKIEQEALYDGMYAVTTDLLDAVSYTHLKSIFLARDVITNNICTGRIYSRIENSGSSVNLQFSIYCLLYTSADVCAYR